MLTGKHIIVFDGFCNLCDYSIQFIIPRDKEAKFLFISGQSEKGKALQSEYGVQTIADGTVILIKDQKVYIKSDAAIEIARELDAPWNILALLRFIPNRIRDYLYSLIAHNRYRWFGKKTKCLIPDMRIKDRFYHD